MCHNQLVGEMINVAWAFVLLLGLGANLDNLGVGLSYGIRGVRVDWKANTVIAGVALLATAAATALGHVAGKILAVQTASHIGAVMLFLVGLWVGVQAWLERFDEPAGDGPQRILRVPLGGPGLFLEILRDPSKADLDRTGTIERKEALLLGIALSLNNLGIGLGGGLSHYPVLPVALVTAAGSWITIAVGGWLGRTVTARWLGRGASFIATALLLALAVWEWH
jgi:putative sporulation protein YtaF